MSRLRRRRLWVSALAVSCAVLTTSACADRRTAVDAIWVNGNVITMDAQFTVEEAFAVRDGRVVAVGTTSEIRDSFTARGTATDLQGRTVVPGFNDNHVHLGPNSAVQPWRTGRVPRVASWARNDTTLTQLLGSLAGEVARADTGEWIRGGLTRMDWPNQKVPARWALDDVAPENPVLLTRGPHTYVLNSSALALAGIDASTPDPDGGWIVRDERGVPTGRVLEAARRIVDRVTAPPAGPSHEEGLENMRRMLGELVALGITSVNVAGVRPEYVDSIQELYDRWGRELPRATLQIRLSPGHDTYDDPEEGIEQSIAELEALGFRTGFGNDRLKIGAIKMSIDGGLSAPVFWSLEPYPGRPGFHGAIRIPADVFYPVAKRAHDLGWQLGIHTMGDGAVQMVVEQLDRILGESPRQDHRHYLHHVAVKPPEGILRLMADREIMVASQPSFTVGLGAYAAEALDGKRLQTQNPTRSLQEHGIIVSHGSDSAPYGPLITIWTAVTRRGWDSAVYGPEEAVSATEALRLHTVAPAYFTFDEDVKGSIQPGMLADFVVLGADPLSIDPERIHTIEVLRTVIGGVEVYGGGS
jgi:predicted amidohydrolase YtcJ